MHIEDDYLQRTAWRKVVSCVWNKANAIKILLKSYLLLWIREIDDMITKVKRCYELINSRISQNSSMLGMKRLI
ncbi:hypothetical protein RCL_jg23244.t1 [Rhizophagus clarus]|uniref:Uncharacterized protein n=1 Tax=Rhizophagus clarus TaxID=94130 RepID=A0A8H3L5D1_9GLOM|nr:hypothetical protein RCL_jg23244.t1 [Rhizophagus clarus]